jgi:tetratricopeptide (TPR) repeat protein
MKRNLIYRALVLLPVVYSLQTGLAQQTQRLLDPYLSYERAVELFQNKKYASAQLLFDQAAQYIALPDEQEIFLYSAESEYYAAICAIELNNPDAENAMLDFVARYPGHALQGAAQFQLGKIYFKKKRYGDAIEWFEQVDMYDLGAEDKDTYRFQYGYSLFTKKRLEEAKKLFQPIKDKQGPYYLPANYYYGFIAYFENEYDEALKSFERVQDDPVYSLVVPYYFANIYFSQGKYQEVVDYAVPLLSNTRLNYYNEINQLVGKAYFNLRKYKDALPYLEYYLEKQRKGTDADYYQVAFCKYKLKEPQQAITYLTKIKGTGDSLAQHADYLEAQCLLDLNKKPEARNAFQEAVAKGYDERVREYAQFNYGKLSYELGYYPAAVSALKTFIETYPKAQNYEEAQGLLAESLLRTRNYEEALAILESLDKTSNKLKQAYQKVAYYSGVNAYNDKSYNQAYELFGKSLEMPVDAGLQAACYFWIGEIEYIKEDYGASIRNHNKFLELSKGSAKLPVEVKPEFSNYAVGYAYFRQGKYDFASKSFEKTLTKLKPSKTASLSNDIALDATLRAADCYFMLKDYKKADKYYETVASNKYKGADYALFQQGMLNGLQSKNDGKISVLKKLTSEYNKSLYVDDAMYEIANTYFIMENNQAAITQFKTLLSDKPGSPYTVKTYLKLGLIYYNLNDLKQSEEYYRKAYEMSPTTSEGAEAKDALKDIAEETGNVDGLEGVATASEKDSISYNAAMNKYNREEFSTAVKLFNDYLKDFPKGFFRDQAVFYRGESYFKQENYVAATKDYTRIIDENRLQFLESALLRASWIMFYQNKDYARANDYYTQLYNVASYKENTYVAMKGLLRTAFMLNDYDEVILNAGRILASDMVSKDEKIEAHFYSGKSHLAKGEIDKAYTSFKETAALTTNEAGVESRFIMADILFQKNKLEDSKKQCLEIVNDLPAYEEWVIRSYILLADISAAKGDYAQAKASLRSIIDNYEGDPDLIELAKFKLEQVEEMERNARRGREEEGEESNDPDELEFNKEGN